MKYEKIKTGNENVNDNNNCINQSQINVQKKMFSKRNVNSGRKNICILILK